MAESRPDPAEPTALDALVERCLDELESDGPAALERICRQHPDLAAGLRRRISSLHELDLVPLGTERVELPERLGDFAVGERLGEGAMGLVHRGTHASTGREVALKIVRPELLVFDSARERFAREARLAARLEHPGLLSILAYGEAKGLPWFATELVRGGTLHDLIAAAREAYGRADAIPDGAVTQLLARLPLAADGSQSSHLPQSWTAFALELTLGMGRALEYAHANGVLHRDVKASNVLLDLRGRAVLADLGLAVEFSEGSLTRSGSFVGSLAYVAPEVIDGARGDVRADVYSLGVTLYEMLALRRPFQGATTSEMIAAITAGEPPRLGALYRCISGDLEAVVRTAMARDPRERYATVPAFVEDLLAVREGRPTQARPWTPWQRAGRSLRRRPAVAVAVVLGVLLLLAGPASVAWVQAAERRAIEDAADELRGALALAESERERANRNLDQASKAIDTLLTEAGDRLLTGVPMMRRVQVELLERALALVEGLQPEVADDPRQRLRAARLHLVTARMCLDLGERQRAAGAVAEGLRLAESLEPTPEVEALSFELRLRRIDLLTYQDGAQALGEANALLSLDHPHVAPAEQLSAEMTRASLEFRHGHPESARAHLDAAIADARAQAEHGDRDLRRQLARLLGMRGTQAHKWGRHGEAVGDLEEAVAINTQLAAEDPEWLRPRVDSLALRNNLVGTLSALDRADDAEVALAVARVESERLVELFPSSPLFATRHAGILANQGFLASKRGDFELAEALTRETVQLCRIHLDSESPDSESPDAEGPDAEGPDAEGPDINGLDIELVNHAAQALQNLASLVHSAGRHGDCIEATREAEPILEAGLALAPGDPNLQRILQTVRILRAFAAMATDDDALADESLAAAEDVVPEHPDALRLMAHALMRRAGELAPGDAREHLHSRALACLVRAVDAGYDNRLDLERTPQLAPLRELEGYPTLDAE